MPWLMWLRRITIEEGILELTKQGAGMTTLFLLVMGVCQSLNELGVVSVTKKWSGQNRTSRTACYGPAIGLGLLVRQVPGLPGLFRRPCDIACSCGNLLDRMHAKKIW